MSFDDKNQTSRSRQAESSQRYLAFSLRAKQFAIPLLQVKEVIGIPEFTPIPKTPPYFKGLINLRGQVISVIDLRKKLAMKDEEDGPETAIIILDMDAVSLGVIVDSINCVLAMSADDLSPAPDGTAVEAKYLAGVGRKDNHLTLILDMKAALSSEDRQILDQSIRITTGRLTQAAYADHQN